MKKIKHSKFKNTGLLYELLVRQITTDILKGSTTSVANKLVQKYFLENKFLARESRLYQMMVTHQVKTEAQAVRLLEVVLDARKKISSKDLKRERYELIKEIKDKFDIQDFLRGKVGNYKLYASLYKVFEDAASPDNFEPEEIYKCRNTIVEYVVLKKDRVLKESDELLRSYEQETEDIRHLSYKLLVESFNKKYDGLDVNQKSLLREYINNISNTNKLREYVNDETDKIIKALTGLNKKLKDDVTKIKITEVISQLQKVKEGRLVKDNQVTCLLTAYELVKELKKAI